MAIGDVTEELMRLDRPAAVLWDLDGTLVDSEPVWTVALNEAAERLGRPLTPEARESMTGTDDRTTMRLLAEHTGYQADEGKLALLHARIVERVADIMSDGLPIMPHAISALETLHTNGIPQALVTSSPRRIADLALAQLGDAPFATVITADDVSHRKPDPAPYLLAARRLGVASSQCWAVEDSETGSLAAESAGCVVILAPTATSGARRPDRRILWSLAELTEGI